MVETRDIVRGAGERFLRIMDSMLISQIVSDYQLLFQMGFVLYFQKLFLDAKLVLFSKEAQQ